MSCGVQEEAKQEVLRLEGDLSKGKRAALDAIAHLEANARHTREEAAAMREEQHADHQARMAALDGEVTQHEEGFLLLFFSGFGQDESLVTATSSSANSR